MISKYDPNTIEQKWQTRWEKDGIYRVSDDDTRPRWYELTMYPYPSGDLHIGHWYAMAPADCHARFRRMQGYNVLHPMGFDAFGLPAENAAIKRGIHPLQWTMDNINNMRRQLRTMGTIYDWDREIVCAQPEYYKWNQWLFLKLYESGLAYRDRAPVVWCPSCQTVLANEQVLDGCCERCETPITRRDLEQWFLRITAYADQLLDFSGLIDWPEKIITMQRNWVGRSEGVEIAFDLSHYGLNQQDVRTFTTRIDTIFGVTFMVLAPEHPLVESLTSPTQKIVVDAYVEQTRRETEIERLANDDEKTGVPLGTYAINYLNGQKVPIFIADYVLMAYGTGAVMGVPAHDQRDFQFAQRQGLPISVVVEPPGWRGEPLQAAYVGEGSMINSSQFNGLHSRHGKEAIADLLEYQSWGRRSISYKMRDWLISRQRYWGTPIPMLHCQSCGIVPIPEIELPVLLPHDAEFKPTGESPLASNSAFANTECTQCGKPARRETDTMDTFVDSSWYMMRYTSPKVNEGPFDSSALKAWMPVDQYTGGAEHAVMHLLYARFFTKALRDLGLVEFDEPFLRLFNQGIIVSGGAKMSKSRGNVVTPDLYVREMGADVIRAYLMFVGPWEHGGDWSDTGINGIARWINRVWEICQRDSAQLKNDSIKEEWVRDTLRQLHKTIRKCHQDLDSFKFNTAIAALMEFSNHLNSIWKSVRIDTPTWEECIRNFILMLAPITPHIAEELWEMAGYQYSIHDQAFPKWDTDIATEEIFTLVVQVNGRVRDKMQVRADIGEEEAKNLALDSEKVRALLGGGKIERTIYVPHRLVNVVLK
jgi:leucyl-tRNA synthetase